MVSEFGKRLRKLRIDQGEILKDMADRLNISSAYLSAIEIGKRPVPEDMVELLGKLYGLDKKTISELNAAADQSIKNVKLNLNETNQMNRNAALTFARNFESMDQATAKKIIGLFERGDH